MNAHKLDSLSAAWCSQVGLDNKVIDETVICLYKIGSKDDVFYRKTL